MTGMQISNSMTFHDLSMDRVNSEIPRPFTNYIEVMSAKIGLVLGLNFFSI